ncbi:MAG: ubiquinone biosynthesis protein [Bradymonadia bacterium]
MAEVNKPRSLLRAAVSDLSRFAFITNVLIKHGYSSAAVRSGALDESEATEERAHADATDAARRFRSMLEELGPTFVKVGQILSTRPDLLPPPFIVELAELQDNAPRVDGAEIQAAVEEALDGTLEELFQEFDLEPVASASMAQTHGAVLPDGTPVIVKVQRPGVGATIRSDLDLMHVFARLLEVTIAEMDYYAPGDIVSVLDEALSQELDFLHESRNLETFAEGFGDNPNFMIPKLYPSHTAATVLTMERVQGRKISALTPGTPEAEKYSLRLIEALFLQIFEHGTFHGDPHPGNLFVTDDDRLAFIDFGLCGYLSTSQRDRLVSLIISVLSGDIDGMARVLIRMGRPLGHIPMAEFKGEVSSIRERYMKHSLRNIDLSAFLDECIDAAQRYRIRIATDYSILSKAAVTIEGVIRTLTPDLDLMEHVGPYQRRLLHQQYSADKLLKGFIGSTMHLGNFLSEVPDQLEQVLMDVEAGRFRVRINDDGARAIVSELNRQTTRLLMGLAAAAFVVATPLVFANESWWLWGKLPGVTLFTASCAFFFGFWALTWHLMGGRIRDWRIRMSPILKFIRR